MTDFARDLRYAVRALARSRGLTLTAILSIALGIAANTAVFSFVNAIQFKQLPFVDEGALVDVEETSATELCSGCAVGTSYPTWLDWRSAARSFSGLGAYSETRMIFSGAGEPERIPAAHVSASLFPLLGIQPALGRGITAPDDAAGAEPVVVLSDALWRRRLAGDAAVLGRTVKVNGVAHTVIGVMPPGFRFPEFAQFWTALAPAVASQPRTERDLGVIGRLQPGVDVRTADAEMRTIAAGIAAAHPESHARWTTRARSLRESLTSETVAPSIVLLGAVTFVLLIACANVSNLLIVRTSARQREIAIRLALGASRARVFRLLVAESLVLSAAGGLIGGLAAMWASVAIVRSMGFEAPYWIQFGLDWHVLAFCAAVTVSSTFLFGTGPALHGAKHDPQSALKEGGAVTAGRRGRRFAHGLVVAQLALALVLLACAGLLIKTVSAIFTFDPGYDASRVAEADIALADRRYEDPAAMRAFVDAVIERMERRPGVRAGVTRTVFFAGFGGQARRVTVEGQPNVPEGASPSFYFAITPGYFRMLGVRVTAGREFVASDAGGAALVNEAMAQRLWPGEPAVGRRIRFGDRPWLTVIGVVANTGGSMMSRRFASFACVPFAAEPGKDLALMASTDGPAGPLVPQLRAAVKDVNPDQPAEDVMTMADAFREQAAPPKFVGGLMASLAFVALALASIGLYGVTAYGLRRRRREFGIRIALGGTAADVTRLAMSAASKVVLAGLVIGLAGAVTGTRLLEGILFGTSPTDPVVLSTVTVVLAMTGLIATYVPARRAAQVDPVVVLRDE